MASILISFLHTLRINTTTEHAFVPDHLSRQPLGPGQYVAFVPGPTASRASGGTGAFCPGLRHQPGQNGSLLSRLVVPTGTKGPRSLLSRLEALTGTKGCPGWCLQPGQKALAPLSPSLSPRPSHSAHLFSCCSWLGIEEFLLISSPHL